MSKKVLLTVLIEERNFHNAWAKAVQKVLKYGADIDIGGAEQRKPIKDACILVALTGNAIRQVENREIHPQYPFKRINEYCQEFTEEFMYGYRQKPEEEKFAYLYGERLMFYQTMPTREVTPETIDQISWLCDYLKEQIENNITSNRIQASTWIPKIDLGATSPPCLQRIQIRYIPENQVDVHLTWRSRDLFTAWQSNVICVIDMLNREVVKPNNCEIVRIIDFSDSLHIYKTDIGQAKEVKLLPVSPQDITGR